MVLHAHAPPERELKPPNRGPAPDLASGFAQALRLAGWPGVNLRPLAEGDLPFLRTLYATTRAEEVAATGWPSAMQQEFLAQQFLFQHRFYQEHHAGADFMVMERHGQPLGRLYWGGSAGTRRLIDISLMPEQRGQGLGSALLQHLLAQADARGDAVELHVEPGNPARRLYARLGFRVMAEPGVYLQMRREPMALPGPAAQGHSPLGSPRVP